MSQEPKVEYLGPVLAEVELAHRQEDLARNHLADAERIRKFWDNLSKDLSAGSPANVLLVLRNNGEYVQRLKETKPPISGLLDAILAKAKADASESAKSFGRVFPQSIRAAGIEPDKTSRHPEYSFRQGFIRLKVDEKTFSAKLTPRDGNEILLGMDVDPLVEVLVAEEARIFRRQFQPDPLLRSIYTAYLAALKAERRKEGEEVPLRRVTNRLAKNLNRFAADEFNVDLAQLVKSGQLMINNRRMHLNHTRQVRQGMLLHGLEEGGYVGFISFKKEEQ